jgi:hypothetical protein
VSCIADVLLLSTFRHSPLPTPGPAEHVVTFQQDSNRVTPTRCGLSLGKREIWL